MHFQVEICVTSILNHSAHLGLHASVLQNHDEKPDSSDGQDGAADAANAPTRAALVANVSKAALYLQFCSTYFHHNLIVLFHSLFLQED